MAEDATSPALKLDKKQEVGFISFFRSLGEKPKDTIRIFDRKDFYTVHGQDALFIADDYFRTRAVVRYLGSAAHADGGLPSVSLRRSLFESTVRDLLLNKRMKVEVWIAKAGSGSIFVKGKTASPGNVKSLEDDLFATADLDSNNVILAVRLSPTSQGRQLHAAAVDTTSFHLHLCSVEAEDEALTHFESLLVQTGARECLISGEVYSEGTPEAEISERAVEVLQRCDVAITKVAKGDFNSKHIDQDVKRLLRKEYAYADCLSETTPMLCLAALLKYLQLMADEEGHGRYSISKFDLSQYMKLDNAAIKALNLLPTGDDRAVIRPQSSAPTSVFALLNKCRSAMGSRLLQQWLKQPLVVKEEIERRQDLVQAFVDDIQLRQSLRESHLKGIPDLNKLNRKFQKALTSSAKSGKRGGVATLQDIVRLYQLVSRLGGLRDTLQSVQCDETLMSAVNTSFSSPLSSLIDDFDQFEQMVETAIDMEAIGRHEYLINPAYHPPLGELKAKKDEIESEIDGLKDVVARDLKLDLGKVKLDRDNTLGLIFRVTRKDEKPLRNTTRYSVLKTRKDGVCFTSAELKRLTARLGQAKAEYEETQAELEAKAVEIAASYCPAMETLSLTIAELDVLLSLAVVAAESPNVYVRPVLHRMGEGSIRLVESRHPCLELQDEVAFIANDAILEKGVSHFQIITGPNMGGKSTYIRQVGAIVLMAQIGSFVPCTEAEVSICDSILARLGAGDFQLKGVSTFMAEMLETATILRAATSASLVIVDELGRGTSTFDGFGLAWAISEKLARDIGCFTLFATHFHELTSLADEMAGVNNRHVTAHVEVETEGGQGSLTMLYEVRDGACDDSFGIHVAELARFPPSVVELARRKVVEFEGQQRRGGAKRKRGEEGEGEGEGGEKGEEEEEKEKEGQAAAEPAIASDDPILKNPLFHALRAALCTSIDSFALLCEEGDRRSMELAMNKSKTPGAPNEGGRPPRPPAHPAASSSSSTSNGGGAPPSR